MRGHSDRRRRSPFPAIVPFRSDLDGRLCGRIPRHARLQATHSWLRRTRETLRLLKSYAELGRRRQHAVQVLLRGMTLGHAEKVHPVPLLVPADDAVHLELAVCQGQDLLPVNVHVHQMLVVAGRTVA